MKKKNMNIQLFAEPKSKDADSQQDGSELSDIEIATLANKELRKKDEENAKLRKELAQLKLYSTAEEEESEPMEKDVCLQILSNPRVSNHEYAEAVVGLVESELAEGRPNPLGRHGNEVCQFFKDVLEECDGDKSRFTSIYQSKLGSDDAQIAMAYRNRQ